jgi:hypothetical protein
MVVSEVTTKTGLTCKLQKLTQHARYMWGRLGRHSSAGRLQVADSFFLLLFQSVYLMNEHQPDRTTSETPYFCYSHLLAKLNIGAIADTNNQKPNLDAQRTDGTDQQDEQLPASYYDVSPPFLYQEAVLKAPVQAL